MKKIHLLCNAHLDPVWLWPRDEGLAEALSTFRVAVRFCKEYDAFVFNHNEAVLYEWVEEHEPALFEEIKELVAAGKWNILGGWYLQPDCLMPSGEGFLRQIEVGNRYFMEKFGVKPTTAMNIDSFGHTRGLVQILKKSGYDSYLFMRPYGIVPQHDFIWKGYDGSEVIGHCISPGYNTNKGKAAGKLNKNIERAEEGKPRLMLWGIGNHGGGPSEIDLQAIEQIRKEHPEVMIAHSGCKEYFADVDKTTLKTEERSMVHTFIGCYTSMAKVKQTYRMLENELVTCEKMLAASDIEYNKDLLKEAEKALLFCQFHDILPGTMIKKGEEDTLRLLGFGREIVAQLCTKAFIKLCNGQPAGKAGEIPVMVFNPHPYPVTEDIEVEFQLEDQNWNDNEYTLARVRDKDGNYLPAQNEKEACCMSLDWRKRVTFKATLAPMSINRFDCELYKVAADKNPIAPCEETRTHFIFNTDTLQVKINKKTGLLDRYCVNGKDYLKAGSAKVQAYLDNEDPWRMDIQGYDQLIGDFKAVSAAEANAFRGYPKSKQKNVLVIENGDVRCKIQAIFKNRTSYAVVTYVLPKHGTAVDIKVRMLANDPNTMFKLTFATPLENAEFLGQTALGREVMRYDGNETPFQKWCALTTADQGFGVLNKGTYGGSAKDGVLSLSMMRTPVYSAHPIPKRPLTYDDRCHDHIDLGEREFDYRLTVNMDRLDKDAEVYNQPVYALSFFPAGTGEKKDTRVVLSNEAVLLTAYKKIGDGKYFARLFNTAAVPNTATLEANGNAFELNFGPYDAKAYIISGNTIAETALAYIDYIEE